MASLMAESKPFAAARQAYDAEMPLRAIQRKYRMNDEEIRDMAPEEFQDEGASPEGGGGY